MAEWDRSRRWELHKVVRHATVLSIRFVAEPSGADLNAAREVFAALAAMSPAEAKRVLTAPEGLELGEYAPQDATRLLDRAIELGLPVVARDATDVSYVPVDATEGLSVLLIEDPSEHDRVVREMLDAGVPVRDDRDTAP